MEAKQFFPQEIRGRFILRNPKSEKPTLIYFLVRINGKQLKLSTRTKCYPKYWNVQKQEVYVSTMLAESDIRNNIIANNKISQIKLSFERFLTYVCHNPTQFMYAEELIRKYVYEIDKTDENMKRKDTFNIFSYLRRCISDDNIEYGSKNTYQRAIDRFEGFVKEKNYSFKSFNDITKEIITEYQTYLCNLTEQPKCKDGKLSVGYINDLIKTLLQRLDNYAVKNDVMDKSVLEKAKTYKSLKNKVKSTDNAIALRDEEVYRLYHYKAKNKKDDDIKNLFILNCLTGQRISDTQKIDDNINNVANITTIQLKQKKCGTPINVPLLFKLAVEILEKYPEGLPHISEIDINSRIKIIAKDANIATDKKTISRQSGNDTNATTETICRYNLISTHTGRRTFITMLALRGYDERFIKDYSGHADIRMVERYSKTTPSEREIFAATSKNNPHMILEMIDNAKEKKLQQSNNDFIPTEFLKRYEHIICKSVLLELKEKENHEQLQRINAKNQYLKDFEDIFNIDDVIDEISKRAEKADQDDIFIYHQKP